MPGQINLKDKLKIGDPIATTNVKGYGSEIGFYLGRPEYNLILIQFIGPAGFTRVFEEDFDKTFFPIKFISVDDEDKLEWKKKGARK